MNNDAMMIDTIYTQQQLRKLLCFPIGIIYTMKSNVNDIDI